VHAELERTFDKSKLAGSRDEPPIACAIGEPQRQNRKAHDLDHTRLGDRFEATVIEQDLRCAVQPNTVRPQGVKQLRLLSSAHANDARHPIRLLFDQWKPGPHHSTPAQTSPVQQRRHPDPGRRS
jgi:hypothetical protein